jgi:hypothetical protein
MLIDQEKDCEALQWPRRESQEIDVATKDRGSCCLSRERSFTHENALAISKPTTHVREDDKV